MNQSFADYHFPQAVRILDFSHAMEYVAKAGQSVWGEGTKELDQWYERMRHQFRHQPPQPYRPAPDHPWRRYGLTLEDEPWKN